MVDLKSQISNAESIYNALFSDIASGRPPSLQRSLHKDLSVVKTRLRFEGIGFVTKTLPSLGKAVIQSFQTATLSTPSAFKQMKGTSLPMFLGGLMQEVFEDDGTLRADASKASLTEILQVCMLAYKLDIGFEPDVIESVLNGFLTVERELQEQCYAFLDSELVELATALVGNIFEEFDPHDIVPRHGPGRVATREWGMEKWTFSRKYRELHECYPTFDYFVTSRRHLYDCVSWYRSLVPMEHGTARIRLVPKDSRGPRIISMEPLEFQYIQQGLWRSMKVLLESHPFTRGHVNFSDQTVNQKLARKASVNGSFATLDMKDASDRVSLKLTERLFSSHPKLWKCMMACRSKFTEMPDGTHVELHKFAPMGSALCFPVESVVHYALAIASVMMHSNLTYLQARKCVYVYGDDLIIATRYARDVMKDLTYCGLMFNPSKCFLSGPFRESCGMDAFKGTQVTPIRWRKPWPVTRQDAEAISSLSECASAFYRSSYFRVAELLWKELEGVVGKLPTIPASWDSGFVHRITMHKAHAHLPVKSRWNEDYQSLEYRLLFITKKTRLIELEWPRVHKHTCTGDGTSVEYSEHSSLQVRWKSVI